MKGIYFDRHNNGNSVRDCEITVLHECFKGLFSLYRNILMLREQGRG